MIKLQELTPEVYYRQSRDFQFIGRLYDVVLNHVKTNADNLYQLPIGKNMNEQLLSLLALTLGFKPTKNYNSKQLLAICSVLPEILHYKGSITALTLAANALLAAENIEQALDYAIIPKQSIVLYVSQQLSDLTLLKDLLDYILPAGICCNIVKESQALTTIETIITMQDSVTVYNVDDKEILMNKTRHELSTIVGTDLALGAVGDLSGNIANTTIVPPR